MKIIILFLILIILLFILDLGNIKQREGLSKGPPGLQGSIGKTGIQGKQGPPGILTPVIYPLNKKINEKIAKKVMSEWQSPTNRAPDGMCSSINSSKPVWSSITNNCVVEPDSNETCASLYKERLFWNGTNCIKPSNTTHCKSISGDTKAWNGTSCVPPTNDALCLKMDTEKPTWSKENQYCVAKPKNDSTCAAFSAKKPVWSTNKCVAPNSNASCTNARGFPSEWDGKYCVLK